MTQYTPTQEDIKFAKQINDEIIWTQTLNPNAVKAAFQRLFGYPAVNANQAKIQLFAYFQYQFKGFDTTETAEIKSPSVTIDNQSHTEDDNLKLHASKDISKDFIADVKASGILDTPCTDCPEVVMLPQTPLEIVTLADGIRVPKEVADILIPFDEDETHQDMSEAPVYGKPVEETKWDLLNKRIKELEQEYQTTTDTGRKRSISMKITNMKKKLK